MSILDITNLKINMYILTLLGGPHSQVQISNIITVLKIWPSFFNLALIILAH
jgi:hypothetical protein